MARTVFAALPVVPGGKAGLCQGFPWQEWLTLIGTIVMRWKKYYEELLNLTDKSYVLQALLHDSGCV